MSTPERFLLDTQVYLYRFNTGKQRRGENIYIYVVYEQDALPETFNVPTYFDPYEREFDPPEYYRRNSVFTDNEGNVLAMLEGIDAIREDQIKPRMRNLINSGIFNAENLYTELNWLIEKEYIYDSFKEVSAKNIHNTIDFLINALEQTVEYSNMDDRTKQQAKYDISLFVYFAIMVHYNRNFFYLFENYKEERKNIRVMSVDIKNLIRHFNDIESQQLTTMGDQMGLMYPRRYIVPRETGEILREKELIKQAQRRFSEVLIGANLDRSREGPPIEGSLLNEWARGNPNPTKLGHTADSLKSRDMVQEIQGFNGHQFSFKLKDKDDHPHRTKRLRKHSPAAGGSGRGGYNRKTKKINKKRSKKRVKTNKQTR
jgi:hypothetical protein